MRRRPVLKPTVVLFGGVAAGSGLYGLLQGYKCGETLIAAIILAAFVVGVRAIARMTLSSMQIAGQRRACRRRSAPKLRSAAMASRNACGISL